MRVLLIEDEPTTAKAIELMLTTEGFNVYTTDLGEDGLDLGKLYDYDIILLDLNLPDMHGYDVLQAAARRPGADADPHPFRHFRDRIRRSAASASAPTTTSPSRSTATSWSPASMRSCAAPKVTRNRSSAPASWRSTSTAKTVEVDGARVHLTGKEYAMLELLSLRKGTTLTKEMFLNHLYGGMDEPELKIIDVFICKLRKKLSSACGGENYIETVWGRGYVLRDPGEEAEAA